MAFHNKGVDRGHKSLDFVNVRVPKTACLRRNFEELCEGQTISERNVLS